MGVPGSSVGKESACNAGDRGDIGLIPGLEDPQEEGMATHSSIPSWRIPMDRGAWWAKVCGGRKEVDKSKQLSTAQHRGQL